jgi:hypothetical protein
MLPDFDNTQKWLNWFKTKRLYKIWVISPVILLVILVVLWNQLAELKKDLYTTRNELIPIKQLYPKLELSAAVAELIKSHKMLENEINLAKQKEIRKHFVPLSKDRVAIFQEEALNLANRHPNIDFEIEVLSDSPTNDLFRKAIELVDLFKGANIEAKYANTMFSSEHNVVIKYSEALPKDVVDEIDSLLRIVFKDTLYREFLKAGGKDRNSSIVIYFIGTPSFDNEGCVFYDTQIF